MFLIPNPTFLANACIMTMISPDDVLCGKGRSNEQHSGNKRYNELIKKNCKRFWEAPSFERSEIVKNIRSQFKHFLFMKDSDDFDKYDESKVHAKIRQALNDTKRKRQKKKRAESPKTIATSSLNSGTPNFDVTTDSPAIPMTICVTSENDDVPDSGMDLDDTTDEWNRIHSAYSSFRNVEHCDSTADDSSAISDASVTPSVLNEIMGDDPKKHDVIFSRGRRFHTHPGNVHFRNIIHASSERITRTEYEAFELEHKQKLLKDMYLSIASNHGAQFYKYSPSGQYKLLNQRDARSRIGQALRDCYRRTQPDPTPTQRPLAEQACYPSFDLSCDASQECTYSKIAMEMQSSCDASQGCVDSVATEIQSISMTADFNEEYLWGLMEEDVLSLDCCSACSTEISSCSSSRSLRCSNASPAFSLGRPFQKRRNIKIESLNVKEHDFDDRLELSR